MREASRISRQTAITPTIGAISASATGAAVGAGALPRRRPAWSAAPAWGTVPVYSSLMVLRMRRGLVELLCKRRGNTKPLVLAVYQGCGGHCDGRNPNRGCHQGRGDGRRGIRRHVVEPLSSGGCCSRVNVPPLGCAQRRVSQVLRKIGVGLTEQGGFVHV